MLNQLRGLAKSYAGLMPGGSIVVDRTFDELETLSEEHGVEVQKILGEASNEVRDVIKVCYISLANPRSIVI